MRLGVRGVRRSSELPVLSCKSKASMKSMKENGGEIARGVGEHAPEITAKFRDPSGNVFGLFQGRGA